MPQALDVLLLRQLYAGVDSSYHDRILILLTSWETIAHFMGVLVLPGITILYRVPVQRIAVIHGGSRAQYTTRQPGYLVLVQTNLAQALAYSLLLRPVVAQMARYAGCQYLAVDVAPQFYRVMRVVMTDIQLTLIHHSHPCLSAAQK